MMIEIGPGLIVVERIVAVASARTAPLKRLIRESPTMKVVVMTGGQKRETVIMLDSGHVVVTAVPLAELKQRLNAAWQKNGHYDDGGKQNEQVGIFMVERARHGRRPHLDSGIDRV